MLIYVIPFILLLVVAIVLKKREASKEAEPKTQKAVAAKNKAKKPVRLKNPRNKLKSLKMLLLKKPRHHSLQIYVIKLKAKFATAISSQLKHKSTKP